MKHIKLFESFQEMGENDMKAISMVLEVSKEYWFKNGEDPPEELEEWRETLMEIPLDDEDLEDGITVCYEGPGYTDVVMEYGILISDAIEEGAIEDEDEAYEINKGWFAAQRAEFIKNLPYNY
jgi:hypothetical protein